LLGNLGSTDFKSGGGGDTFIQNTHGPSTVIYEGDANAVEEIIVPGTTADDTFEVDFNAAPNDNVFTIYQNGVPAIYTIPNRDVQQIVLQGLNGNDTATIK